MIVNVKLDVEAVRRQIGALTGVIRNVKGVLKSVADWMLVTARQAFGKQQSPEGQPWAELSPRYALRKAKIFGAARQILQARGALRLTLFSGVQGSKAFVESTLPYALAHQEGVDDRGVMVRGHSRKVKSRDQSLSFDDPISSSDFGDLTRSRRRRLKIFSGVGFVKAHHRNMFLPKRSYLPGAALTEKEGTAIVEEHLREAIRKSE